MPLKLMPSDISELSAAESKVLARLKRIYSARDSDTYLYIHPVIMSYDPDFILIDPQSGVCIIDVMEWSPSYVMSMDSIKVADINGTELRNPVHRAMEYFSAVKDLLEKEEFLLNSKNELSFRLCSKVIFTYLSSAETKILKDLFCQPVADCISGDQLSLLSASTLFGSDTACLDSDTVSTIRGRLFPELQIKRVQTQIWQFNRTVPSDSKAITALDYEQEQFARRIPYGHYMVTGVPGSGKTVILIARAIYLLRENPGWKIKILTYNRSLEKKISQHLRSKAEELQFMGVRHENIEVSTFHRFVLETAGLDVKVSGDDTFWDVTLPYIAMDKASPVYDAILIDEYQDFQNSWLKLCLKVCKKHPDKNGALTENLFLAGDRLQSIYNMKDNSWKSLGINIIGRSKLLRTSYRSGCCHISLAMNYLMSDGELRKEVEKFYEGREGICHNPDSQSSLSFFTGNYKQINKLILDILEQGYRPEDILVLGPSHDGNEFLYANLDERIRKIAKVSKHFDEDKLLITTYHSAKGLENKVCILLNVDRIDNKKLIYVALTRASEKLYIHSYRPEGGEVFRELYACYDPVYKVPEGLRPGPGKSTPAAIWKAGNEGTAFRPLLSQHTIEGRV